MHQFSNSFILYILKKYVIFLTEYANLYLKRMKIFFFKKNHDFNALRKFDIFFQTESTKEKKNEKYTPTKNKKAGQGGVFIYMYLLTNGINQCMSL